MTGRQVPGIKTAHDREKTTIRVAEPQMAPGKNLIRIDYRILAHNRAKQIVGGPREAPHMGYPLRLVIHKLLSAQGFDMTTHEEPMTGASTGF